MKGKIKDFIQSSELKVAASAPMACAAVMGLASAAEGDTSSTTATIITAFQTGFQQIASDAMSMIAVAAPIALGLAGTIFLARKAISWFKSMAK